MVRFGPFDAMVTAGKLEDSDAGKPVWKVWWPVEDESQATKLAEGMTREAAVQLAQRTAELWRTAGRPTLTPELAKSLIAKANEL